MRGYSILTSRKGGAYSATPLAGGVGLFFLSYTLHDLCSARVEKGQGSRRRPLPRALLHGSTSVAGDSSSQSLSLLWS